MPSVRGQQSIPETQFPDAVVVPNRLGAFGPGATEPSQIIIEKPDYYSTTNPNFDTILNALGLRRFVVFGVATECCVRADALTLRQRGLAVDLVTDAIKPITEEGGRSRPPTAAKPRRREPSRPSRGPLGARRLGRRWPHPGPRDSILPHVDLGAAPLETDFIHELGNQVYAAAMFGKDVLADHGIGE